jgi:hypothetical protein
MQSTEVELVAFPEERLWCVGRGGSFPANTPDDTRERSPAVEIHEVYGTVFTSSRGMGDFRNESRYCVLTFVWPASESRPQLGLEILDSFSSRQMTVKQVVARSSTRLLGRFVT